MLFMNQLLKVSLLFFLYLVFIDTQEKCFKTNYCLLDLVFAYGFTNSVGFSMVLKLFQNPARQINAKFTCNPKFCF
jgi:hypothetical protein